MPPLSTTLWPGTASYTTLWPFLPESAPVKANVVLSGTGPPSSSTTRSPVIVEVFGSTVDCAVGRLHGFAWVHAVPLPEAET